MFRLISTGHIGQSFSSGSDLVMTRAQMDQLDQVEVSGMYSYNDKDDTIQSGTNTAPPTVTLDQSIYKESWSCYDTPGVVNSDQVCYLNTQF